MDHSSKAQPDLDSPVQPSREVPNERDEDKESVEETPPPSPMPPKCEEESTPSQQCPQSTSATELEDTTGLNWLNAYGASQTPAFVSVTSRPSREQLPYLPIPAPGKSLQPAWNPTNPLASPLFGLVPPVNGRPPQPEPTQRKWYNEVKNLRTNEFSHTDATNHHGSPTYFPFSYPVFLGSPTDPRATPTWLPRDPPPPSPSQAPCYRPTSSSRGAPSTIAGSSRPAWSVSSSVALPKLHTKGHRQEPYQLSGRPGQSPRTPRPHYGPQPRVEAAQEAAASATEPEAGPAPTTSTLHDKLSHRVEEEAATNGPAVSVPKTRRDSSMPKGHFKGHRQEPYASSRRLRARPTPPIPKDPHDDLPHRGEGVAKEAAASVDETDAALPIREKQPVVGKGEEA
ncbi:unnamed protein product [Clonostachys byssicola]|uniref:Uncharacterized protein n=1 Tax=Clonostachys byssicola TaxID=160290 RepID=A0A9N9Y1D3_9HYPO|nr:unnamed protein product [Clonostachys byssicola]